MHHICCLYHILSPHTSTISHTSEQGITSLYVQASNQWHPLHMQIFTCVQSEQKTDNHSHFHGIKTQQWRLLLAARTGSTNNSTAPYLLHSSWMSWTWCKTVFRHLFNSWHNFMAAYYFSGKNHHFFILSTNLFHTCILLILTQHPHKSFTVDSSDIFTTLCNNALYPYN